MSENGRLVSVVVPAHNEAENLEILLPRLHAALKTLPVPFEIIVVDNASTDHTPAVIENFRAQMPEVRRVSEPTMGYGRAVLCGFREAQGGGIGIIRADNQEKAEDLVRMIESLLSDDKNVFYKAVRMHRINDGWKRVIISRVYNLLFKILFGLRSKDLNATPKVFTRTYLDAAKLESLDWFIDAEMVIKAERMGYTVNEMDIEYLPRLKGTSTVRMRHIFEFLGNMLRWWLRVLHGRLLEK